jgi:general secretion pathway protein M
MRKPSPFPLPDGWTGRLLALAILTGLLGIAYLVVAAPLRELYIDRQALLQDRRIMLARLEAASREVPTLCARLVEMQAVGNSAGLAISGSDDATASANLLALVESLVGTLGVTLDSTEVLPTEDRDGLRLIGLRIAATSDYESLLRLFGKLESSQPLLIIDNLQIRANVQPAGMQRNSKLGAVFDISAFRRSVARSEGGKMTETTNRMRTP